MHGGFGLKAKSNSNVIPEIRSETQAQGTTKTGERINKLFKGSTPKVSDDEIKGLINKYPPPPNIQRIFLQLIGGGKQQSSGRASPQS